ncbi:aminoglycoside phosphotransferase family protein [Actinopolymorpha pittospori]|uniref:Aminoglycoside phosphotransferase domain-containing protein n=1 Tax=Actinopolymorpha pittospori TaxID=648752 RepID=A0A927MXY0_9ACTN|nr:hypothetical protein [Actinopolymorpha pittospori]
MSVAEEAEEEVLQDRADRHVVRAGATVRHAVQPWTPAVHALLEYLADAGFAYSPRVLGVEPGTGGAPDTEILTYIEGESGPDGWAKVVDEDGLRAAARLLREYHDTVASWAPERPPVWAGGATGAGGPGEVVCHGDFGPWNIVWDGVRPVGLLDWEYAAPHPPWYDVAYALEYLAPFRDDEVCVRWLRYPVPPDRRRRVAIFAEAYGLPDTAGLADSVIEIQRIGLDFVRQLAAEGHERQVTMVAEGHLDELAERIRWSEEHRHLFD